jgi:hypothetical protein
MNIETTIKLVWYFFFCLALIPMYHGIKLGIYILEIRLDTNVDTNQKSYILNQHYNFFQVFC